MTREEAGRFWKVIKAYSEGKQIEFYNMIFAEVIEGLKNGQNFTRFNSSFLNGKFITMQIPTDIPTDVIPKMTSLNDGAKAIIGTVGDCQIHHRNQVLMVNQVDGEENIATYYMPTWEDIFADDWICV